MAIQYIRIANPKFLELDNNGRPAAGYLIYTLQAGTTSTLVTTFKNRELTSANSNPIELDSRGEANIFTNVSLKLVYCAPGGSLASPIWTEDYASEQLNTIVDNCAITSAGDNLYTGSVTPPFTAIPERLSLVVTPDTDSQNTLGGRTFNDLGINDAVFGGSYLGTNPGSIFSLEITSAFINTPSAVTLAENAAAGSVTAGAHTVKITALTSSGETLPSAASNAITAGGSKKLDVTGIPAIGGNITGYKIYLNTAGGATWYLVATVVATTYTINIDDVTLSANAAAPSANTTGDGVDADIVTWQKDGGTAHAVAITAASQLMQEGVTFIFSEKSGHTEGAIWTVTVMTPVVFDFCGITPGWIVYKNVDGQYVALEADDFKQDFPAHIDAAVSQSCWILINPKVPVLTSLPRKIFRKEIVSDYTMLLSDLSNEISYTGPGGGTLTLLPLAEWSGGLVDINNASYGDLTIAVDGSPDIIITPENPGGVTSMVLGTGQRKFVRLVSNGVNAHMDGDTNYAKDTLKLTFFTSNGTWTKTAGYNWARVRVKAGGGGAGSGTTGYGGGGGGEGGYTEKVIDISAITSETVTVGDAGAGGGTLTDGGTSSFGTHCSATGGKVGSIASSGGDGGDGGTGVGGDLNFGGQGGSPGTADTGGTGGGQGGGKGGVSTKEGQTAGNYGAGGGGGGASAANKIGGNGSAGFVEVMEFR